MSERPTVSIVMATYHWPEALACSIPSVIAQSYSDWELLVVGDGCTDDSMQVVQSFDDSRIRWLNLSSNSGSQGAPNNEGIANARGELIAYLGHDDVWSPDHLQSLVENYDGSTRFFASAAIAWFDEGGDIRLLSGFPKAQRFASRCLSNAAHTPSGIAHSRILADQAGNWADWRAIDRPPDIEFFHRLAKIAGPARCTGHVTVGKVASGWRKDSYKRRDVSPQRKIESRLKENPAYLQKAAFEFIVARYPSTFFSLASAAASALRHRAADFGGRMLVDALRLLLQGRGARVRDLRRFRGLDN